MGNKQNAQAGDRSGMAGVVVVAVVVVEMVVNKASTCQLSPTGGPTSGTDGFYRGGRYPTTTMTTGTGTSYDGPSPFFPPPFERLWHQSNETKVITTAAEG